MAINYKKRIINDRVAPEINADPKEVDLIFESVAEALTKHIEQMDVRKFRITYLGSFRYKPFRRWVLNNQHQWKKYKQLGFIPQIRSIKENNEQTDKTNE